jgi:hypothetical protein
MLIAPVGLVAAAAIAWVVSRKRATVERSTTTTTFAPIVAFSLGWLLAFLGPVLPIVLRSELYLYLPVFGLCLLAGRVAEGLLRRVTDRRIVAVTIGVFALALTGYQIARARERHQELVFSEKLVAALQTTPQLVGRDGRVLLEASDAETERYLQDAVGGYFYLVLQHARHNPRLVGDVQYRGDPPHQADIRLACAYPQDGAAVVISPAP